ncbi:EthD domain-containing protein [Aspergillus fischeri NRRL 181]|uniref:EthD domain-containing protein n=1 Tax=Neosartorya fischeri (strain ATCC 1020 / DSM 3700 / CBS 544.65 / FGSC A1164 / JCM 1740 / NRRL 181 / WB 181) TaxID=331117 RepID=A1DJM5_NEOFI|nr:uncharacterized protein NFIA_002660 [Aspergillus fischeri NRRL 181]EAW16914.1 hypothetical protein NFIA_002660 [Aspergillus fischeri NRRL 181]
MATLNRNLRVTMFAFKKDEISEEEFHNHWSKVHAPIVAEFLAKAGVIKYTQVMAPDEAKFFDWTKTSIAFGWEEIYVENGQPLVSKEGVARL